MTDPEASFQNTFQAIFSWKLKGQLSQLVFIEVSEYQIIQFVHSNSFPEIIFLAL